MAIKKKVVTPKVNGHLMVVRGQADDLATKLESLLSEVYKLLDSQSAQTAFPQPVLRCGLVLDRMRKMIGDAFKHFEKGAVAHHELGGTFEHGRIAIDFRASERRTPSWKSEAITQAEAVATLKGVAFDSKLYEEMVLLNSPVASSTRVILVESA